MIKNSPQTNQFYNFDIEAEPFDTISRMLKSQREYTDKLFVVSTPGRDDGIQYMQVEKSRKTGSKFAEKLFSALMQDLADVRFVDEPMPKTEIKPILNPELKDVKICHAIGAPGNGGVTIAYRLASEFKNCRMVEVAVAYCHPKDTFSKKVGTSIARENFVLGKTLKIPANNPKYPHMLPETLKIMFGNWISR